MNQEMNAGLFFMSAEEAAGLVQWPVRDIYLAMESGDLGHIRNSRGPKYWRINMQSLIEWLESQTVRACPQEAAT
jgi:hypothetical protein